MRRSLYDPCPFIKRLSGGRIAIIGLATDDIEFFHTNDESARAELQRIREQLGIHTETIENDSLLVTQPSHIENISYYVQLFNIYILTFAISFQNQTLERERFQNRNITFEITDLIAKNRQMEYRYKFDIILRILCLNKFLISRANLRLPGFPAS